MDSGVVIATEDLMDTRFTATDIILLSIVKNSGGKLHTKELRRKAHFKKATFYRSAGRLIMLKQITIKDKVLKIIKD